MRVDPTSFDYASVIDPLSVRRLAVEITSRSIDRSAPPNVGYLVEIFEWVREHVRYVPDPLGMEYVQTTQETLETSAGDCEDMAILMASFCSAVGVRADLVHVESATSGHMFAITRLGPEAPSSYALAAARYYRLRFSRHITGFATMSVEGPPGGSGIVWCAADPACAEHIGDTRGWTARELCDVDGKWQRPESLRVYGRVPDPTGPDVSIVPARSRARTGKSGR